MAFPLTVRQVAQIVSGSVVGDPDAQVNALAGIEEAGPGDLTFAADARRAGKLASCRASAALVQRGVSAPGTMAAIQVADVQAALIDVLTAVAPPADLPPAGVHKSAVVDPSAQVAADAAIGPLVSIGRCAKVGAGTTLLAGVHIAAEATIGDNCLLYQGVVVGARCRLGNRVVIGPNSVIGFDGFGYYVQAGRPRHVPHIGTVVIEDDVELGACTCVDRAKFSQTRIGAGTKTDNLVQIAHNVQVGTGCLLAAMVAVGGSAKLGNNVVLGGHVAIRDNVIVGDGVQCGGLLGHRQRRSRRRGGARDARQAIQRDVEDLAGLAPPAAAN